MVRVFDISDFSPAEMTAFNYYVRQSLGFMETTEERAAKTIALPAIYGAASRTIRDRRALVGRVRQ